MESSGNLASPPGLREPPNHRRVFAVAVLKRSNPYAALAMSDDVLEGRRSVSRTATKKTPWSALAMAAVYALASAAGVPESQTADARVADSIVASVNAYRQSGRLRSLASSAPLRAAAQDFANFMAATDRYSHEADGRSAGQRVRERGYHYCQIAENIGWVQRLPEPSAAELARAFIDGWIASTEHREAILDPDSTETAAAVARSARTGRYYGVQLFARPAAAAFRFELVNRGPGDIDYQIEGRSYRLAPHTVHTRTVCGSGPVVVTLPRQPPQRFVPEPGKRYTASKTGDGPWTLWTE